MGIPCGKRKITRDFAGGKRYSRALGRYVGIYQKHDSVRRHNFGHGMLEYVKVKPRDFRNGVFPPDLRQVYVPARRQRIAQTYQNAANKGIGLGACVLNVDFLRRAAVQIKRVVPNERVGEHRARRIHRFYIHAHVVEHINHHVHAVRIEFYRDCFSYVAAGGQAEHFRNVLTVHAVNLAVDAQIGSYSVARNVYGKGVEIFVQRRRGVDNRGVPLVFRTYVNHVHYARIDIFLSRIKLYGGGGIFFEHLFGKLHARVYIRHSVGAVHGHAVFAARQLVKLRQNLVAHGRVRSARDKRRLRVRKNNRDDARLRKGFLRKLLYLLNRAHKAKSRAVACQHTRRSVDDGNPFVAFHFLRADYRLRQNHGAGGNNKQLTNKYD